MIPHILTTLTLLFTPPSNLFSLSTESPDERAIRHAVQRGQLAPLDAPTADPEPLVRLGQTLFFDPILSGNRDIACVHCHHPRFSLGDALPLSIGTGGRGIGNTRHQLAAELTRRNAPSLFNLGASRETPMFWDGRVTFSSKSHSFQTPEPELNGYFPLHPERRHPIVRALDSSLAAQALFPMVDTIEMRGPAGTNEIADASSNIEAWGRLMDRVLAKEVYPPLFEAAFPNEDRVDLNIGHVGTAIAAFQRQKLVANQTPLDRYLRGERDALTVRQKQGAALFVGRARCVECHEGEELTRFNFFTTGVPQIGPRAENTSLPADDLGRFEVELDPWMREKWRYSFRTPPLRNVALTAPYMHNGAFATIREVVEHYSRPTVSSEQATSPVTPSGYIDVLTSDAGSERARTRLDFIDERLRAPLNLTEAEIDALVDFLEYGLTDPAWGPR